MAGAIGPLGIRIEPWGKIGVDEAEGYFREQAAGAARGGVDLFVLETFRDLNEIGAADRGRALHLRPADRGADDDRGGRQHPRRHASGKFAPALVAPRRHDRRAELQRRPAPMLETIDRIEQSVHVPLSAQPNAGRPRDIEGRTIYLSSPEYMASYARRFVAQGVRLVGGCCGTTPEHIRQIKLAVQRVPHDAPASTERPSGTATVTVERPARPRAANRQVADGARAGARDASSSRRNCRRPVGYDASVAIACAQRLKIRGVDVVTISDGPRGGARMSALSLAVLVQQQAGIEPCCSTRVAIAYLLGMQSDLLGAHAIGLRNLLIFTGDPRKSGDYSDATVVFDVDSIGLTNAVSRLNRGSTSAGRPSARRRPSTLGSSQTPVRRGLDEEVRRFEYKAEAGAEFAVTPPVFDLEAFDRFRRRTAHVPVPIIAARAAFRQSAPRRVPGQRGAEHPRARSRCSRACGGAGRSGRGRRGRHRHRARARPRAARPARRGCRSAAPMASVLAVLDGFCPGRGAIQRTRARRPRTTQ